jgi:site-specific recombinase XerC
MLELLYAGALRVSEMVNATLNDLKLDAGYMLVRGKGDKERIVPLGRPAQDALVGVSGAGEADTDGQATLKCARDKKSPPLRQAQGRLCRKDSDKDGAPGCDNKFAVCCLLLGVGAS